MKIKRLFCMLVAVIAFESSTAQILNPASVLRDKVIDKANQGIEKAADDIVNGNIGKNKPKDSSNEPIQNDSQSSNTDSSPQSKKEEAIPVTLQSYSKYDFIPGEKVVFFEDFSSGNIGDFPVSWNTNGSGEVVNNNIFSGKWLSFNNYNNFVWSEATWNVPQNYTIEFDILFPEDGSANIGLIERPKPSENLEVYNSKNAFWLTNQGHSELDLGFTYEAINNEVRTLTGTSSTDETVRFNKLLHIACWITGQRIRVYVLQKKILDLPRAIEDTATRYNSIAFNGNLLISNIRVAAGLGDARSKLIKEGKLVSYGIYFDTNKDVLKPESYGALKAIADALKESPQVRINIVGHTDTDGKVDDNLALSKRRAAAVKAELVKTFGITADRIEIDGKGQTQPIAPNDNPSNKALNRRVEFIKI
jgi:OmpA-OmpF porin, OOP family